MWRRYTQTPHYLQHEFAPLTLPAFPKIKMGTNIEYLLSLRAIRERAAIVGDAAEAGQLNHFDLHGDRMDDVADYVTSVIKVRSRFTHRGYGKDRTNYSR